MSGPVAKAARFWAVFCTPSARPDQLAPGQLGGGGEAQAVVRDRDDGRQRERHEHQPGTGVGREAQQRHAGRRQDRDLTHRAQPAAHDVGPAAGAEAAERPGSATTASTRPASLPSQPRPETRYSAAKVAVANCGTTSRELAACTRHSVGR